MSAAKLNANPTVYTVRDRHGDEAKSEDRIGDIEDEESLELFTAEEVFELIRDIQDPEHPLSLEQLNVVAIDNIKVENDSNKIEVRFTPTVPHCSMSTLIGLCLRVKLLRSLPKRFKVDIFVTPGSHASEDQVNKQLNDKERVCAALENPHLLKAVNKSLTAMSA